MNLLPPMRAAYGALLVSTPDRVIRLYSGRPAQSPDAAVLRVLGIRHLCQAAMTARTQTRAALLTGASVDVAHAVSMIAVGVADQPRRRAALTDAAVAGAFATAGVVTAFRRADRPLGRRAL